MRQTVALSGHLMTVELNLVLARAAASEGATSADGVLHAIDPDHRGPIFWPQRVGRGSALGGIQRGPAADDSNVYAALSDIGIKLKQSPGTTGTRNPLNVCQTGTVSNVAQCSVPKRPD